VTAILLYESTERNGALRHEVPIVDSGLTSDEVGLELAARAVAETGLRFEVLTDVPYSPTPKGH
jgi:hypothetical protein